MHSACLAGVFRVKEEISRSAPATWAICIIEALIPKCFKSFIALPLQDKYTLKVNRSE